MGGFYYLCTPYSSHPRGQDAAHDEAVAASILCIKAGISVFCPIAHSHEMAKRGGIGGGFETWQEFDKAMIRASRGVIVVEMDGWRESTGIKAEIDYAKRLDKPVLFMPPEGPAPRI